MLFEILIAPCKQYHTMFCSKSLLSYYVTALCNKILAD